MTKPDPGPLDDGPSDGAILLKRALIGIVGGLGLIFFAGMIAGYSSVMIERGAADLTDAAILGAMLLIACLAMFGMWRLWPRSSNEPIAPKIKSARRLFFVAILLSVALGLLVGMSDNGGVAFLSNAPVAPMTAAVAIALWLIAGPVFTWLWWQKIDEHEIGAYSDGATIAIHAYFFVTPSWWMATRAGWLPPQDPMIVLIAVCVVWLGVWFVRRYL